MSFLMLISTVLYALDEHSGEEHSGEKVDFFSSMHWNRKSANKLSSLIQAKKVFFNNTTEASDEIERLHTLENLYNKNVFTGKAERPAVIPKIIHQIWVGPKTPPEIFKKSQESIKKYHPDWEYRLWTDADIPALQLHNQKFYDLAENFGAKADILRYELLYKYGGVYLDVDFVCLKSFDVLCQYDLWGAIQPIDCMAAVCNGVIGAVPGHPILQDCITSLEESWNTYQNGKSHLYNVVEMTGPLHFQRSFMKFVQDESMYIIALPASFFFPITFGQRSLGTKAQNSRIQRKINSLIKPEAFAIHYWAASWWDKHQTGVKKTGVKNRKHKKSRHKN